jgi:DNA-binding transcriptional MerR regulator
MTRRWNPRPGESVLDLARRAIGEAQSAYEAETLDRLRREGCSTSEIREVMRELRAHHVQQEADALAEITAEGLDTAPTIITH